jgi:LysR family transcriptional regulator, flagellar master operon regulator
MQIELIDTFLDLVETRSFNRTADRMGVTQSTVSARVKSLEDALGAQVFRRSRAGTDLTTEGLRFETHARLLRQEWTAARRAVTSAGDAALTLRIGMQNDLAAVALGTLVAAIRKDLPQTALYIEPDYSTQMCNDLVSGALDFAVMFTPKAHPDLHFTSVGEITYKLISSDATTRAMVNPETMIFAHFSPAFERTHRMLLPEHSEAPLSVGQSMAVSALLLAMGGSGYVTQEASDALIASGRFQSVTDAPVITQPIYAAMHLKNRPARLHRRLTQLVARHFAG